jgi:hypothetical protein
MSVQPDFAEFLRRIRCGDPEAAQELVRRYESTIRLAVRTRLTDPALKRAIDRLAPRLGLTDADDEESTDA